MKNTIVLNADFTYLNTVSWKKAIKLIVKGKAETLKGSDKKVHKFEVPLVLRLLYLVKAVYTNMVPFSRKNVYIRDNYACVYCGNKRNLTLDHVVPKTKGGKTNFENCVTCCRYCNNEKGSKTIEEFGMRPRKVPHRPTIIEFLEVRMRNTGVREFLKKLKVY
jgi:5-methylcytosine-specific restriction endonuclease McrA